MPRFITGDELLACTPGTVFSFVRDNCDISGPCVLEEILYDEEKPIDFTYREAFAYYWPQDDEIGMCVVCRDGVFDEGRRFLLYDADDIRQIASLLSGSAEVKQDG
jgi:hypothetical protein